MRRSVERVANVAGQLAMIAVGAYLGLQAEQWREDRSKAALARATVQNFRDEIRTNRAEVAGLVPYQDSVSRGLHRVFNAQFRSQRSMALVDVLTGAGFNGVHLADFQTTAYELAVATQALGELPPPLGLRIARLYTEQRSLSGFQTQFAQALMTNMPAPREDGTRALFMLDQGMTEIARQDRKLVAAHDSVLPRLDSALAHK